MSDSQANIHTLNPELTSYHTDRNIKNTCVKFRRRFREYKVRASDLSSNLSVSYAGPEDKDVNKVVIFVHGFCGNKGENGLFDAISKYLLQNNVAVLLYDWRGIGKSQGDFSTTTLDDHVHDLLEILNWYKQKTKKPEISIDAVGFSLGATLISLAMERGCSFSRLAYLSPALRPRISMWPRYTDKDIWSQISEYGYYEKENTGIKVGKSILDSLKSTDLGKDAFVTGTPLFVCWGKADSRIKWRHNRNILRESVKKTSDKLSFLELEEATHSLRPEESVWPKIGALLVEWFTSTSIHSRYGNLKETWKRL